VTVDTNPDVQPGSELRFEFIGPAGKFDAREVM
jgi:hypothetical protein